MTRLTILLTTVLITPTLARAAENNPARPNVVMILVDDLGWSDLGCYGATYYETPNIDKLAANGMRFTNGYTCGPNCQPTRAALMSGQYAPRTGTYTVGNIYRFNWETQPLKPVPNDKKLDLKIATYGESLKKGGYTTGYFGKWHLGNDPQHHPLAQGFDEAIVARGKHFNFKTQPKVEVPEGIYLADFITNKSVDFIKRHQAKPFFLEVAHFAVHSPHQAKKELIAKFQNKPPDGGDRSPVYAAMIASVDQSVGRIIDTLDQLGLSKNTLVIFTSDNGGVGGYRTVGLRGKRGITSNRPLKGGKGTLYEGGIRVAYIFRRPGTIKAGTVVNRPINSVDLYPTLLELTGAPRPDQPLDGQSYLPILRGGEITPRGPMYWHFPGYLGFRGNQWRTQPVGVIRDGDWKLMQFFEDSHLELYNLAEDLGEEHNLAEKLPQRAEKMRQALVDWRKSIGARMPTPHEPVDKPKKNNKRRNGKQRKNKNKR